MIKNRRRELVDSRNLITKNTSRSGYRKTLVADEIFNVR